MKAKIKNGKRIIKIKAKGDKETPAEEKASNEEQDTKKTGTYKGKSNALGHGGRAQQLRDKGVPEGVIGAIARSKGAAPGQKNYHG